MNFNLCQFRQGKHNPQNIRVVEVFGPIDGAVPLKFGTFSFPYVFAGMVGSNYANLARFYLHHSLMSAVPLQHPTHVC